MKYLLITAMLFNSCFGQNAKWWQLSKLDYYANISMAISGTAKGFHEAILFHHYKESNQFWDKNISWKNKYRNWDAGDKRSAFPFSKNAGVIFTDGYHLSGFLNTTFLCSGITFSVWDIKQEIKQYPKKDRWKYIVIRKFLFPLLIRSISFELTYKNL